MALRFDIAQMSRRAGRAPARGIDVAVIRPTKAQADELAAIYMKVIKAGRDFTQARLIKTYERSLGRTRDSLQDSPSDIQQDLDSMGAQLERLILTLIPELRSWVIRIERWHRTRWTADIKTATTVDLSTLIGPADAQETMQAVLARNIALIKDVSAEMQGRIADAVWRGWQARSAARDVAKAINDALDLGRKRSLRIASDQVGKLSSALDQERRRQAGIEDWIWRWSHKLHGRPEHIARDGKFYTDATAPKDLPGDLPFCGCKAQAHITFD